MDALVAIDALDDLVHNAPNAFLSDDVRVDPDEIGMTVARLRAGLEVDVHDLERSTSGALLARIETQVREARPVRWGRRVRVGREALYDLLDELRRVAPDEIRRSRQARL